MTYYQKHGNRFQVTPKQAMDLHEALPAGTFTVGFDQMSQQFYLEEVEDFVLGGKIYGDTHKNADRILNTFHSRSGSTGVMLSGEKGSGKTLLAKLLSVEARNQGIPTIIINQPWAGEAFNGFMQTIEQPTIVIFDEFEKVYDRESQEKMLTLLDGVYPSKKMFILTCNDKYRVNEHMKNRPGRIFYRIDYKGLSVEFIREYCEDNLDNKDHIDSIARISAMFGEFNFDILKALVEDMNRYQETAQEVMVLLNAKPEFSEGSNYEVTLTIDGVAIEGDALEDKTWSGNPVGQAIVIDYIEGKGTDDADWKRGIFSGEDLKEVDPKTGKFTYINKDGERLTLSKKVASAYNYHAF